MINIKYPTIDLFVYNLKEVSDQEKYKEYWENLSSNLQQQKLSTITAINDKYLEFEIASRKMDGSYSHMLLDNDNVYCLNYTCSFDEEVELSRLASIITELKNLVLLPKLNNLTEGKLSENGYLGKTWMISGWTLPNNSQITENEIFKIYKALINEEHQSQIKGQFLGGDTYEMWRGQNRWEGMDKESHIIMIFYPDENSFINAAQNYYIQWSALWCWRHKIIWAYQQGKSLKQGLAKQLQHQKDINELSNQLSIKKLDELRDELEENSKTLALYIQNINLLKIQQHTVKINLDNYQIQCAKYLPTANWLQEFSEIVEKKYQVQLEQDYLTLSTGLAILENTTNTIRGMVEIEQTQRDRHLNNTVAIAGVGLATSQIASSIMIAQEPPPQDTPFFQTTAFWYSIATGIIASLILWSILRLYDSITNRRH